MNNSTNQLAAAGEENAYEISVIIPAFNAAQTISRAIESVRIQEMDSMEIIVVDDGSADDTYDIANGLILPGEVFNVLKMPKNSGVSAARNAGIRHAKGKFLAFLDADDIWLAGKLKQQVAAIKQDPLITLVSCNSKLISESGEHLKEGHVNRPPVEGDEAWKTLLIYNFLPTPTVLTYRHLVTQMGGFDETLAVGEDLDLWIRLAMLGKVRVLKDILINYYDSTDSLMKRHLWQTQSIVQPMLEKHLVKQHNKLSSSEVRHIRGTQSFQMGCNLFFAGAFLPSIPPFLKAAYFGIRPLKSAIYIPRALLMEGWSRFRKPK
ncbi:glycosyltransferase family 2 protein [Undibacterium sp.]|jgi:GT2 family glycosyltransferase|uniref:glycosyltransferase family 2 protein n=1 Tax=Undibacterium sp. TaxID=1914977 RepID=UPI002CF96349|nr:glycosyltransferase family 2 protein [Undibacterium sp.]HTD05639.1 glycosyltransferase family 2 protein [Undibacterium sp.]